MNRNGYNSVFRYNRDFRGDCCRKFKNIEKFVLIKDYEN